MADTKSIPTHVGLILDGNRRWARSRGLTSFEGHSQGKETLKEIAREFFDSGVKYVSAFVFSTENWSRTKDEVSYLMNLALKVATESSKELTEKNIRIVVLGSKDRVSPKIVKAFEKVEAESASNTGGTLAICFNYGGYQELSDAVSRVIQAGVAADKVTPEVIAENLYYPEIPPIDFLIRTSGEQRISNFMLWRAAYAELYFVKKHWPDFSKEDIKEALEEFGRRNRRFGGN